MLKKKTSNELCGELASNFVVPHSRIALLSQVRIRYIIREPNGRVWSWRQPIAKLTRTLRQNEYQRYSSKRAETRIFFAKMDTDLRKHVDFFGFVQLHGEEGRRTGLGNNYYRNGFPISKVQKQYLAKLVSGKHINIHVSC